MATAATTIRLLLGTNAPTVRRTLTARINRHIIGGGHGFFKVQLG